MRRRGQIATEYMMAVSVVVIFVVFAAWQFYEPINDGFKSFKGRFTTYFAKEGGPQ